MKKCAVCHKKADTRPYGEGGTEICFPCATATPESEKVAMERYGHILNDAPADSLIFLGLDGPKIVSKKPTG